MPIRKTINIKNPYNPMSSLYKKLTKLWAGPITSKISPKLFDVGKKNLDKYGSKFKTATSQEFQRNDIKHPSYYLYMDSYTNAQRAERYLEFDQMEMHPDCAAVLETYADEITCYSELNPPIKVISNNLDIKECITSLLYTTLNMPMNFYSMVYALCLKGDAFYYLDIDEKLGVTDIIQIPAEEVERMEGQDESNPRYIQFQWNRAGQTYEYGWNMVHFRLLGSPKYAPYGQSVYDSARRAYHQLCLLENYILGYRIVRSSGRKVFEVDVGGMNDEDIPPYIQEIKKNLREDTVIDSKSGHAERRYSAQPISKNSIIPLLDGRNITIEQLSKEYESGKQNWVYSINDKTHEPLSGKVEWCGRNYTTNKLIKVILDDNTFIETAPEHPFILKSGQEKRADELLPNDALMPFYREYKSISGQSNKDYEAIYNNKTGKYNFTHRIVANDVLKEEKSNKLKSMTPDDKFLVIHHKLLNNEFNRHNNSPENLEWMGDREHVNYHASLGIDNLIKYNKSDKHRKTMSDLHKKYDLVKHLTEYNNSDRHAQDNHLRSKAQKKSWQTNKERMINLKTLSTFNITDDMYQYIFNFLSNSDKFISLGDLTKLLQNDDNFINIILKDNQGKRENCIKLHRDKITKILKNYGHKNYEDFILSLNKAEWIYPKNYKTTGIYKNHKVQSIEIIEREEDVYCMTVVGPNGENNRHNFACLSLNQNGDFSNSGIFLRNSVETDYVIAVRGANSGTKITSLPADSYSGEIQDLKHARDKLFTSLGVASAYFSQDAKEDRQALASKDIKFGKRVLRMQNHIIAGLTEIVITHLYILGFRDEDLENFELKLNNPSRISEMQELEQMRTRLDLANSAGDYFSKETIYKKFLGLSDTEIKKEMRKKYSDAKYDLSIQQFEDGGDGGGLGGGGDMGGMDSPIDGMGDMSGDENPFGGGDDSDGGGDDSGGDESLLLSEPSDSDISDISSKSEKRIDDDDYLTPGAKGKRYTREPVDKRFAGARLRSNKAQSPISFSKATKKNLFGTGFEGLKSFSRGIVTEQLSSEFELSDEELHSINEELINTTNTEKKTNNET